MSNMEIHPEAYAQHAILAVMSSGEWYTTRQLMKQALISDPRATIRNLIDKGYCFDKKRDTNSQGKSYKLYRLIKQEGNKC